MEHQSAGMKTNGQRRLCPVPARANDYYAATHREQGRRAFILPASMPDFPGWMQGALESVSAPLAKSLQQRSFKEATMTTSFDRAVMLGALIVLSG